MYLDLILNDIPKTPNSPAMMIFADRNNCQMSNV